MIGIDVSKHNGNIDWKKVDASGIDFVLIRAGYGNDISQKDKKFEQNIQGALKQNLNVGIYWFSYAISADDAKKEAEVCKSIIEKYKGQISFPIAFDYEYDSIKYAKRKGINPSNELINNMARAFLESLNNDGWFANIYTNKDFIVSGKFSKSIISAYDLWLADYSGDADFPCGIQQTSSTGRVPGISGNVDMNIAYKEYPTIIQAGGYNGYSNIQNTKVEIDTTMDITYSHGQYYIVKTICPEKVTVTAGTGGVVTVVPFPKNGNDQLFALVAIGKSGQETGIYTSITGEKPLKRFKYIIK